jgi:hypothetical protein
MQGFLTIPPDKLAEIIWRSEQAGAGWHVPLYRAVMAREIALFMLPIGGRVPLRVLDETKRRLPLVIVLAGDNGEPSGPDAYPQSVWLLRWARFILLHGAGGEAQHYAFAVEAVRHYGRLLLIETQSGAVEAWAGEWRRLALGTPGLGIITRPGDVHPNWQAAARGVFQ